MTLQWKPLIPYDPVKAFFFPLSLFFFFFFYLFCQGFKRISFHYFFWAPNKQSKLLAASSTSWMVIFQSCSMWQFQVLGAFRGQMDDLQSPSRFLGSSSTVTAPDWFWQEFKHCDTSGLASGQWSTVSVAPRTDPSATLCSLNSSIISFLCFLR